MKITNFGQVLPFQNGWRIWIIEEEKIFSWIFYIEKHVNLSIENLALYDTYEFLLHSTKEILTWTFQNTPNMI